MGIGTMGSSSVSGASGDVGLAGSGEREGGLAGMGARVDVGM